MDVMLIVEAILAGVKALTPLGGQLAVLAGADAVDVQKGVDIATRIEGSLDPLALELIKQGAANTNPAASPVLQAAVDAAPKPDPAAGAGIVSPTTPPASAPGSELGQILDMLKSMDERLKKVESFHA